MLPWLRSPIQSSFLLLWLTMVFMPAPEAPAATPKTLEQWIEVVERAEARGQEEWAVLVHDMATSQTIFAHHPQRRLIPASNRKIATFGLALETLGPDHVFRTEFGLAQPHTYGNVHYHGDLVLQSAGDPSLDNPYLGTTLNPADLFTSWARKLRDEVGIVYVHGDLVINASAFGAEQNQFPEAWDSRHRSYAYAPVPTALAISQNLIRATVRASSAGKPGSIELWPPAPDLRTINRTRTFAKERPGISMAFNGDSSELILKGGVRIKEKMEVAQIPLPHPLEISSRLMAQAIETAGVRLTGEVRIEFDPAKATETLDHLVGWHESPKLNAILMPMMLRSNNFIAEQVWRAAAARVRPGADCAATREVELEWYRRNNIGWIEPGFDGSGLSLKNRVAPVEMVALLETILKSAHRDLLLESLPVAGVSGTLRHRSYGNGGGRVVAKTGTLAGTSALSGFILDATGQPRWSFSVIGNGKGNVNGRLSTRIRELIALVVDKFDEETAEPKAASL